MAFELGKVVQRTGSDLSSLVLPSLGRFWPRCQILHDVQATELQNGSVCARGLIKRQRIVGWLDFE
jgi:hypothetical protein